MGYNMLIMMSEKATYIHRELSCMMRRMRVMASNGSNSIYRIDWDKC